PRLDGGKTSVLVDPPPADELVKLHARTHLSEENLAGLVGGRLAPEKLGGQHHPARPAYPDQFSGGALAVDEHRDRFGDHPVEPTVRESQPEDVSLLDLDVALKAGASNIAPGSLEHERRDIDRRDRDPEPTRHLNGGSADSAADIERLLPSLQGSQAEELLRRATAARMDHA